jgi:hypothetical protein
VSNKIIKIVKGEKVRKNLGKEKREKANIVENEK